MSNPNYDETTARVTIQSILLDVMNMKIRKTQKNKVIDLLRSILPDPIRYLEIQRGRFSYERPHIHGTRQDGGIDS